MREAIIQSVLENKLIAIVRGVYGEDCLNLAKALYAGGIELLEVTFDQSKPEALTQTSDTIRRLVEELGDKMAFGAGTVTSLEMLELAKNAGVTMTGAGATFPYKKDPADSNIRIAPTYPSDDELRTAMKLFCVCVKLAAVRKLCGEK